MALSSSVLSTIVSRGYSKEQALGWMADHPGDEARALAAFPVQKKGAAPTSSGSGGSTPSSGATTPSGVTGGGGSALGPAGATYEAGGASGMGADILGGLDAAASQRSQATGAAEGMGGGGGGAAGGGGYVDQLSQMALRPLGNRILPQETYALAALKSRAY